MQDAEERFVAAAIQLFLRQMFGDESSANVVPLDIVDQGDEGFLAMRQIVAHPLGDELEQKFLRNVHVRRHSEEELNLLQRAIE